MEISVEAISKQVDKFVAQLSKLEGERSRIEVEISRAKQERDLWQSLLALRQPAAAVQPGVIGRIVGQGAPAAIIPPETEEYGAKSRAMKEHILSSADLGVTPKSIQEFMQSRNMPVSANFVYKTLNKLKADGEIGSIGGVWRPIPRDSAAA